MLLFANEQSRKRNTVSKIVSETFQNKA